MPELLASVVHCSVVGFQSSAAWTAPAGLLNPGELVPPVTSTVPSGNSVALIWRRANAIDPTARQVGEG